MSGSPSLTTSRARRLLRLAFLLLGFVLLFLLIRHVGAASLLSHARRLRWVFLVVVALYGVVHVLRTLSWRLCLGDDRRKLPVHRALAFWVAGEAVAHLSFGWTGEGVRAAAISETIAPERGLSALVVSRIFYSYASLWLLTVSLASCLFILPWGRAGQLFALVPLTILFAVSLLPRWGFAGVRYLIHLFHKFLAVRRPRPFTALVQKIVHALDDSLATALAQPKRQFAILVALNLLATLAGVLEVYLILSAMGAPVNFWSAFLIEGITKALAVFAFFVPGNVGVREAGTMFVLQLFGINADLAVSLVLARRARALVWVGIGITLILLHGLTPLWRRTVGAGSSRIAGIYGTKQPDPKTVSDND